MKFFLLVVTAAALTAGMLGFAWSSVGVNRSNASPRLAAPTSTSRPAGPTLGRKTSRSRVAAGDARAVEPRSTPRPPKSIAARKTASITAPAAKHVVLFVLDGAQPGDYNVSGIPHVRALMQGGADYTNGFVGILESETPSGHATIASGSQPNADGILSFNWASSDNTTVNLFTPQNIINGQMEDIIKTAHASDIGELVHQRYPHAVVAAMGGSKYYAQDALGGPSANVITYFTGMPNGTFAPVGVPRHMPPASVLRAPGLVYKSTHLPLGLEDHMAMHMVRVEVQKMQPTVLMVNLPEFDWPLGHVDGGQRDPAAVRTLMQGFDQDLGKLEDLYRQQGMLKDTVFVLTSDHGFAPIYHTVDSKLIENAVSQAGTSILADSFHTAGYVWIRDASKAAVISEDIARLQNPYIQAVYFKENAPSVGYDYVRATGSNLFLTPGVEAANQYLLHTFAGPNGPNVVVFFTEHSASLPGGQSAWKGDHGGNGWDSQHLRLVISGAGVKPGVVSHRPAPLMDIAPTLLTLMGVRPAGMEGVPLADGMRSPTTAMKSGQAAQARALQPVINALWHESNAEVAAGK